MGIVRRVLKILPGRKLGKIKDLDGWRKYYIRLMFLLGMIAFPLGFAVSIPVYVSEHINVLIIFGAVASVAITMALIFLRRIPPIKTFFLVIYGLSITFLIFLGPYQVRPAWLVMCVVSAAFLFGVRSAIVTTCVNAAILMGLYVFAAPYLSAWTLPHQEPFSKWIMFCVNLSLLSLASGLPVGFLLNRMDLLLTQEQNLRRRLEDESKVLLTSNRRLEAEMAERIRAEEENTRLRGELLQAQKMEALGTLAGGIAHDFNNILSAIVGYGQLVHNDSSLGAIAHRNAEQLLQAAQRAKILIQRILLFSRKTGSSRETLDFTESVSETLQMIRELIPANVELKISLSGSCPIISNPTFVHQILINLLTNAVHAMGADGGALRVEVAPVFLSEAHAKELGLTAGNYAALNVHDSGPGMSREIVERIFEPYFTTKETGVGTGLGLSVVHGIVKNHDGAIVCLSDPGSGTSFHIYLPMITDVPRCETGLPEEENMAPRPAAGTLETLLYVDDEPMLVDSYKQLLSESGYHVIAKTDSREALETFRENPGLFHAVITDMSMPGLTGDKLAREILSIRPEIPVILCSGFIEHNSAQSAVLWGVREVLMKPYTVNELTQALRRAMEAGELKHNGS